DGNNEEIEVTDLWTGGITADVRPANHYGASTVLTATTLEFEPVQFVITSPGGGDGTLGTFVLGSDVRPQVITLTVTDDSTPGSEVWSVESPLAPKDDLPDATTAVAYTKPNELILGFTITAGGTAWTDGDTIVVDVIPFKQDALINGLVIPDVVAKRRIQFVITANDEDSLTVRLSDDMTVDAVATDIFMVIAPQELSYGYDGLDALTDADYLQYLSPVDSPMNDLFGKNYGLVKLASPGVTSTAVQKAGEAYAEARNYQWRIEIPSNITQETDAEEHVNDTIGRNDFG
ncbi:unnamed protein product, partial [marine sediment metagenome]